MPTPTLQQTTAITTVDRALVVEAGAGTGKTWVLVERYLHLLALHPDWPIESIVAITFTEKAAREMRNRIRSGVETRARHNPHDVHWQERRRRLDQIQVSTIHSLCARILRENAIAAALDPKFDVLDEAAATLLAEDAIRQTLADLSADAAHPALALFASLSVFDVKNTMAELLSRRGTVAQLFDELADKATLLDRWKTAVEEMLAQRWQQTVAQSAELAEALDYLPSVPIVDASDLLAGAVRLAQEGCRHITAGDHTAGDFAQAVACFAQISRSGGKAPNWGGAEGKKVLSAMLGAVQQLGEDWVKDGVTEPVGVLDEAAADNLLAWRSLWQTLTATYDKLKDEQHVYPTDSDTDPDTDDSCIHGDFHIDANSSDCDLHGNADAYVCPTDLDIDADADNIITLGNRHADPDADGGIALSHFHTDNDSAHRDLHDDANAYVCTIGGDIDSDDRIALSDFYADANSDDSIGVNDLDTHANCHSDTNPYFCAASSNTYPDTDICLTNSHIYTYRDGAIAHCDIHINADHSGTNGDLYTNTHDRTAIGNLHAHGNNSSANGDFHFDTNTYILIIDSYANADDRIPIANLHADSDNAATYGDGYIHDNTDVGTTVANCHVYTNTYCNSHTDGSDALANAYHYT